VKYELIIIIIIIIIVIIIIIFISLPTWAVCMGANTMSR
jgi:hypothetical protein